MLISKSELLKLVLESTSDVVDIPNELLSENSRKDAKKKAFDELSDIVTSDSEYSINNHEPKKNIEYENTSTLKKEDNMEEWINDAYRDVLDHKIDYNDFLKKLDINYYNFLKLRSSINNMIGYSVINNMRYSEFKKYNCDVKKIFSMCANGTMLDSFIKDYNIAKAIRPCKAEHDNHIRNYMRLCDNNFERNYSSARNIAELYSTLDADFVRCGDDYVDTIRILMDILPNNILLATIIRHPILKNPNRHKYAYKYIDNTDNITTAIAVKHLEYNLIDYMEDIRERLAKLNNPDISYKIKSKNTELQEEFNLNKDEQFIELVIPYFESKYAEYVTRYN